MRINFFDYDILHLKLDHYIKLTPVKKSRQVFLLLPMTLIGFLNKKPTIILYLKYFFPIIWRSNVEKEDAVI